MQNIVNTIIALVGILKDAFLGYFFYKKGKDSQKLKQKEGELKDVKDADKLRDHISTLPDDDLNSGL